MTYVAPGCRAADAASAKEHQTSTGQCAGAPAIAHPGPGAPPPTSRSLLAGRSANLLPGWSAAASPHLGAEVDVVVVLQDVVPVDVSDSPDEVGDAHPSVLTAANQQRLEFAGSLLGTSRDSDLG